MKKKIDWTTIIAILIFFGLIILGAILNRGNIYEEPPSWCSGIYCN